MASLLVIRGQDHGRHFVVRGDSTTIGRDSSNQIRLNDTEVSRQHVKIVRTETGEFVLRDCNSSNGTYVNSHEITSVVLHSGDRIQLGRTLMIFTGGPDSHAEQSGDMVEIVSSQANELDHIRSRAESRVVRLEGKLARTGSTSSHGAAAIAEPLDLNDGEIVYQVSQAISRTVDIDELLGEVLDLIFQWIACHRGCIMLVDEVTGELHPACTRRRKHSKSSSSRPMQISHTILDHVMQNQEGVLTSNAQDDSRWNNVASITGLGIREAICVPMRGRYGVLGAIYVDTEISAGQYVERNRAALFNESHLKLMIAIGGQAALAVEDTQFYRAMLQAERLATMGQTIADVSHHVKNILQGISGGNYLVEDGLNKNNLEVVRRGWAIVKRNQDRISGLVMDMLSFSKDREPMMSPEDAGLLVSEVVESMQAQAASSGVKLIAKISSSACRAMMDREAIHRALLNVVTNAIDAAAAGEDEKNSGPVVDVSIDFETRSGTVSIHVEDNGDGIAPDQLAKIFAPFQSTKGSRGTGLGLPVSQKILREHGGDLTVQSQVGQGSTFTLTWPTGLATSYPTLRG